MNDEITSTPSSVPSVPSPVITNGAPVQPSPQPRTSNKPLYMLIAVVVGIIVFAVILSVIISNATTVKISLNDCYSIQYSGLNGNATATVNEVNGWRGAQEKVIIGDETDLVKILSKSEKIARLFNSLKYEIVPEKELKNGDTVKVRFTYDEDLSQELRVRFTEQTIQTTVQNLNDGKVVDIFEGLEVTFTGCSGFGEIGLNNNNGDSFIRTVRYSIENDGHLKNGEKVTVTATYDPAAAMNAQYIVNEATKVVTVSGLNEYLTDSYNPTDAVRGSVSTQLKDDMDSYTAVKTKQESMFREIGTSSSAFLSEITGFKYELVSTTLLTAKEISKGEVNYLVAIYKVDIDGKMSLLWENTPKTEHRSGYFAIRYKNVSISPDGKVQKDTSPPYTVIANADLKVVQDSQITEYKSNYIVTDW